MPVAQACFVVMKVCEGLDYAHNKRDQAGPRAAPRAPRRLAAERARLVRGRGEADRLRHREGGRQGQQDAGRHPQGQVRLHVARAGARPSGRSPQRRVLVRHRALRAAHRRAPVRRRERLLDAREGAQRRDPAAVDVQPPHPRRARAHRAQGAREGSPRSATRTRSICTTSCRRSSTPPASSTRARISRAG